MKHTFFILATISVFSGIGYSQTEVDLYRYSNTFNEGSARFEAMGGSFGALGADIGCARINPAGFGRYSSSQFTVGMGQVSAMNTADFHGTSTDSQRNRVRLTSLGFVLTTDISGKRQGWLYQQLGFGYTGVANFSNTVRYTGQQFESLLDGFASQAEGIAPASLSTELPFSSSLAYETYTIDDDGANNYTPRLTSGDMIHTRTIATTGGINEMHISYSANYLNKLYIGANVGFQFLRYTENMHHNEVLIDTTGVSLRSFDYYYNLKTAGSGTNLKIGAIYLPTDALRIGLAVHTPTAFELTDNWNADMTAEHTSGRIDVPSDLKPTGTYKYRMRTPARIIGSIAYVFGTKASVNVDVEYLDYRWAHFKSTTDNNYPSYDYKLENAAADKRFTNVLNVRVGAEYVINTLLFIRGGFGYLPKGDTALYTYGGKTDYLYSGGLGIRLGSWTLDAAYRMLTQTRSYTAFAGSTANVQTNQQYIVVSAQYKF
jgi:hypothetical protein